MIFAVLSAEDGTADEGRGFGTGGRIAHTSPTPRPYPTAAAAADLAAVQRPPALTFTKRPSDPNRQGQHQGGQYHGQEHYGDPIHEVPVGVRNHNDHRNPYMHGMTGFGARIPPQQSAANPKIGDGGFDGFGGAIDRSPGRRGELLTFPPSR